MSRVVRVSRGVSLPQDVGVLGVLMLRGGVWGVVAPSRERCGNTVAKERGENWGDKPRRWQAPLGGESSRRGHVF